MLIGHRAENLERCGRNTSRYPLAQTRFALPRPGRLIPDGPLRRRQATPQAEGLARAWGPACFHTLAPALIGVACLFHSWVCLFDLRDWVTGRPGLLGARGGERSEPERVPNRDGGRTAGSHGRKGPHGSFWSPPSFPMS